MHTLRTLGLALSATLLAAATACGPAGPEEADLQPGPGGVMPGDEVPVQDYAGRLKAGMKRLTTARTSLRMEVDGVEVTSTGLIDFRTDPASTRSTTTFGGRVSQDVVVHRGDVFVGVPDGGFARLDPAQVDGKQGRALRGLVEQADLRTSLRGVGRGVERVTYQGSEEVDGVPTDRYQVAVDATQLEPAQAVALADEVTVNVWLDERDRARRISMGSRSLELVIQLDDLGRRVSIRPPSADQLVALPAQ